MVQFYRPGQSEGALFRNNRRQHDRSPDVNGRCLLTLEDCEALLEEARQEGGATLYLSGWNREGQKGPWTSLSPRAKLRSDDYSNGDGGQRHYAGRDDRGNGRDRYDDRRDSRRDDGYDNRRNEPPGRDRGRDLDDDIPFN